MMHNFGILYDGDCYPDLYALCPTCWGNGFITIDTEKFGSVNITCPQCKGLVLEPRSKQYERSTK